MIGFLVNAWEKEMRALLNDEPGAFDSKSHAAPRSRFAAAWQHVARWLL